MRRFDSRGAARGPPPMGWFRSSRREVAWLAVFALACQLVLSFGHVHLGSFSDGSAAWAAGAVPPSSSQKHSTGVSGDFCAICANIRLASMLVVPDPSLVLAPNSFIQILPWSVTTGEHASFERLYFNARGPPVA